MDLRELSSSLAIQASKPELTDAVFAILNSLIPLDSAYAGVNAVLGGTYLKAATHAAPRTVAPDSGTTEGSAPVEKAEYTLAVHAARRAEAGFNDLGGTGRHGQHTSSAGIFGTAEDEAAMRVILNNSR
jgi:hypothetical protein